MPHPQDLPPTLGRHFTVRAALEAGTTPGRLRSRRLVAPFHGVRSRDDPTAELARAYAPKLRQGEHFSHATALALAGGWIPERLRDGVDVAVPRPTGRARGAGVRGHESACGVAGPFPRVPPADAWCQAASQLTPRELVIAADSLLRRKHPILTLDELAEAVDRADRRRHVRAMVDALACARARTDSVAETELRLDAADAGLPEFEVNGEIRDGAGRFLALGDLVHRPSRVLLEYDGEQHRLDRRQYGRDVERLDALAAAGWRVIRVNATHRGAAREAVLARTRAAISSRTRAV